jgi:hypothetical protein
LIRLSHFDFLVLPQVSVARSPPHRRTQRHAPGGKEGGTEDDTSTIKPDGSAAPAVSSPAEAGVKIVYKYATISFRLSSITQLSW